jgi:signal transduction histidine kinase
LFLLCLLVVLPAMLWLTLQALEVDRAEAAATARANLEEEVGLALWRMDTLITPLLAQEAVRPHYAYLPFYPVVQQGGANQQQPSPLLEQPADHVLLHFQCSADGVWSSPQSPTGLACELALANGVAQEQIDSNSDRLIQLRGNLGQLNLLEQLPNSAPSAGGLAVATWGVPFQERDNLDPSQTVANASPKENETAAYGFSSYNSSRQEMSTERGKREFSNRARAMQKIGQQAAAAQREEPLVVPEMFRQASAGVSRPVWVGTNLLFVRQVVIDGKPFVQGCWLNWPKIKEMLLAEAGRLPGADLIPVHDAAQGNPARMLATLPVQLVVDQIVSPPPSWSPIRLSLLYAWVCLLVAMLAVAALLIGLLRLSERRGAFVSAVTHELRTPLTTFRMYSEMLSEEMVPDAARRKEYLQTLRAEADRLWHLVENVLAFARLERGRRNSGRERLSVESLFDRIAPRLSDHARQAEMELTAAVDPSARGRILSTNTGAVEQILFNLVDNACKYASHGQQPSIEISVAGDARQIHFRVRDHGPGISPRSLRRLFKPFSKTAEEAADSAPGIGLGLALCRRLARDLGGQLSTHNPTDGGAVFTLTLPAP